MYTRIGGRYSNWIAWAALLLFLAPGVIVSLATRSILPMLIVVLPILLWVLAALVIYIPVFALKVICDFRNRSRKSEC